MSTILTPYQMALKACVDEIDSLEREVAARMTPRPTPTKEINFELAESFLFEAGDMRVQKVSFKNGAEDLYLYEPQFVAYQCITGAPPSRALLVDTEAGLCANVPAGQQAKVQFDFWWNYAIGSQGENYGSPAQELLWLSRRSLGNRYRWLPLAFRYPLRLKGGDSITFTVKPALYAIPFAESQIVVNMTLTGRRNGRMAESQFDPEFRPAYRSEAVDPQHLQKVAARPEFLNRGRK